MGYNRGGYRQDRYNDDRFERRDNRRDYAPRYRRDNFYKQPERFYGNRRYEDRDRPPRRFRGSNFRGGRGSYNKDRNDKQENGESKRGGSLFRRTGRRGASRGGMRGGKKNETKDTMEDYWKKDAEFMKLKLNKELEDYM